MYGGPVIPAYADGNGMTLYTYDKDEAGKLACISACLEKWRPLPAAATASNFGAWSVTARPDGSKQWAFKGKPLYTFAEDTKLGEVKGNGQEEGAWHTAAPEAGAGVMAPNGVAVQDVPDANGLTLVNARGMTLYAYDGDIKREKQGCFDGTATCTVRWTPVMAPALARVVGDFSVINRDEGIKQWAYKGKALYAYGADIEPGDAHGVGVDKRIQAAVVARHFTPPVASMIRTPGQGVVWANAEGMTVYRRSVYTFQQGGHHLRRGVPNSPSMGRSIGTGGCDAECLEIWRPLKASDKDQSSGYWEVATREDGTKQWTYKGYALFTYAGDKKPGDLNGRDVFELSFEEKATLQVADAAGGTPAAPPKVTPPYYWSNAYP